MITENSKIFKMSLTSDKNNDIAALESFIKDVENANVNLKSSTGVEKSRYTIIFKQYKRNKKETYRSDLNLVNMQSKFGSIVSSERIAIMFLFADRCNFWQWCNIFDNNIADGPEKEVFHFKKKEFLHNSLFKASEIELVSKAIFISRQKKKSKPISEPLNGEVPQQRNVNALLGSVNRNFSV